MRSAAERKAQNDPWSPLPVEAKVIAQPPADPLYQLIDSDRYIYSLEKRLQRVQGRNKKEPSSRDIINSLASLHEDQMRRFMDKEDSASAATISIMDSDSAGSNSASYLQRRLHPERQAINMEELFELLKDDELDRHRSQNDGEQDGHGPEHDDELGGRRPHLDDELNRQKPQRDDGVDTHTTVQKHQDR